MNARTSLRARRSRHQSESGFTLIEMIITVVLMSLIAGAIGAAFVGSLNATNASKQRVHESNDAELISGFLTRDAQAAGGTDPTTGFPNGTLGVSTTDDGGCTAPGSLVLRFKWIDHSAAVDTGYVTVYSYVAGTNELVRTICVDSGAGASTTLGNNIVSVGSPASPFAWCNDDEGAVCPKIPNTVSLRITERDPSNAAAISFTVVLKASLRPQSNSQPDISASASTASLVLLGDNGTCGAGDPASIAAESAAFSLTIYGQAALGGCATDLKKTVNTFGQTFVFDPGTCADFPAPCTVIHNRILTDPFATRIAAGLLTPPAVNCGGSAPAVVGGHWQPGTYPQDPQQTGTVHPFDPGVYVFCNGLSNDVTANLPGGSIGGTFFYFAGGAYSCSTPPVSPSCSANVFINPPTSGQYSGLAIWQPATNTAVTTFNKGTANITGTMYVPGSTVTMKNGSVNINQLIAFAIDGDPGNPSVRVGPPLHVALDDPLPPATQLQPYAAYQALALNGTGVYSNFQLTAVPPIPGLGINPGTGIISGTPTAAASPGVHTVTVTAHDSDGEVASDSAEITVYVALTISGSLPTWTATQPNYPGNPAPLTASGGSGAGYSWSWANQPPGLTMAADGTISGTPSSSGNYNPAVTLTDSLGNTVTQNFPVTIKAYPSITTASLPATVQGAASYSQTLAASGGTSPFTWALTGGTLPTGLTLSSAGVISGSVGLTATTQTFSVTATDANGLVTAPQSLTITVTPTSIAGIIVSNITTAPNPALTQTGVIGSLTYTSTGEPNSSGNVLVAKVSLVDASGTIINSASAQTIDLSITGSAGSSVNPTGLNALTITAGTSTTTAAFTLTRQANNNKNVTLTATLHGTVLKFTVTLAS